MFSTAELCFQRLSHRDRDVGLDAKNVLEFAVVTLDPEMLIGRRANELHIDVHLIGGLLHAALDNVCNPKLTSDIRQIARPGCVLLRRSARDDFERTDFRESKGANGWASWPLRELNRSLSATFALSG